MSWVAVGGAVVGVAGNYLSSDSGGQSNGGAGTQTATKEPWAAAQPWINQNLASGQRLQQQYTDTPFNAQQQNAYGNMANQSAYMRAAVPSLLGQIQGQQVGFDRANPNARPQAFSFDGLMAADSAGRSASSQQQGGLLSMLTNGNGAINSSIAAPAPPPAPRQQGNFVNYDQNANQMANYYGSFIDPQSTRMMTDGGAYMRNQFLGALGDKGGGYGEFKYGMEMPKRGTQAYRDMQEYLAYGGNDPYGLYSTDPTVQGLMGNPGGMGAATDDGGAAAAVGSSANF